jgi:hypothetical protein
VLSAYRNENSPLAAATILLPQTSIPKILDTLPRMPRKINLVRRGSTGKTSDSKPSKNPIASMKKIAANRIKTNSFLFIHSSKPNTQEQII